jgi:hypothetical protein
MKAASESLKAKFSNLDILNSLYVISRSLLLKPADFTEIWINS